MSGKTTTDDPMQAAIDRICASLDNAGTPGKGTGAALRTMSRLWSAGGNINPVTATADIQSVMDLLDKVRKALSRQAEHTGPIKLVPTKLGHSRILSESTPLSMGTVRVSNMNFDIPREPETDKIMVSVLKGVPGKYKQAAMEIFEGRAGLIAWHEKNVGPLGADAGLPIQELLEKVVSAMYQQAVAS